MTGIPAVTVLMTAFNRENYIAAAIQSVLSQTYDDFELVIVDDHSTDRTAAVAREFLADSRVRLIVNERNLGDYPNRNHAASFARGEFLKYHDSDDIMYPHCLAVMVSLLRQAPDAACALTSSRGWLGGPCPMLLTPPMAFEREYLGQGLFHGGPESALFRREPFDRAGRFPLLGPHSDNAFWLSFCAEHSVLLVPGDLFWYRVHAGQVAFAAEAPIQRIDSDRRVWEMLGSSRCPLDQEQREKARRNRAVVTVKGLLQDLRQRQWRVAWHRFRRSGLSVADWLKYGGRPCRDINAGSPRDSSGDFLMPSFADLGRGISAADKQ